MKHIIVAAAALAMVATSCAKDVPIGEEVRGGSTTLPTSPSPTITRTTPTRTATATQTRTAKPAPKPTYTVFNHNIIIRDINNQYEPREKIVYVGDRIIFTNKDPNSPSTVPSDPNSPKGHTFTSDTKGLFDSGIVAPGKKWEWIVNIPPGEYTFHCEIVPYIVGGPLKVIPRQKK